MIFDAQEAFLIFNYGIIPAWLLLALAPAWRGTQLIVHSIWIPCLLGAAYAFLLLGNIFAGGAPEGAGMDSLVAVQLLLGSEGGALVGWIHYLAFDLFVGAWITRDAMRRDFDRWALIPCLFFTLMFGPAGLLLYLLLRVLTGKGGVSLHERAT